MSIFARSAILTILLASAALALSVPLNEKCLQEGECLQGILLGEFTVRSAEECLDKCLANEDCSHFTFKPANEICFLSKGCPILTAESCPSCRSGSREDCKVCFDQGLLSLDSSMHIKLMKVMVQQVSALGHSLGALQLLPRENA